MELVAELRDREGRRRSVRVPLPRPEGEGEAGQLRGLRRGLAELQERVGELLAPLVQEEREAAGHGGGGPHGDDEDEEEGEEEEEEEDEDENNVDARADAGDPPAKRTRVQKH